MLNNMLHNMSVILLKSKPVQLIVHALLICVVFFSIYICILFHDTRSFVQTGGTFFYQIRVTAKDFSEFSFDKVDNLTQNTKIDGYNFNQTKTVKPVGFENWVEAIEEKTDKSIELSINLNVNYADIFINNMATLSSGNFPTDSEHGVVIEANMAEHNNIHVGDIINISIEENALIALIVTGIYELVIPLETIDYSSGAPVYIVSPITKLYTNFVSVSDIAMLNIKIPNVDFYTSNPKNVSTIIDNFNAQIDSSMQAYDATDLTFKILNNSVEKVGKYIDLITYLLLSASIVVLILFSIYIQFKNMYETAIFIVLGKSKRQILIHNFVQSFITATLSITLPSIVIAIISKQLGLYWIAMVTQEYNEGSLTYSFHTEYNALINNYNVDWVLLNILLVALLIYTVVFLTVIIFMEYALKQSPRKIIDMIE